MNEHPCNKVLVDALQTHLEYHVAFKKEVGQKLNVLADTLLGVTILLVAVTAVNFWSFWMWWRK
jgi:hypothetical protein